jgi:uncharacterized protein YacL
MVLDVLTLSAFLGNVFTTVISPNPVVLSLFFMAVFAYVLAKNSAPAIVWGIIMIPLGLFIGGMTITSSIDNMTGSAVFNLLMAVVIAVLVFAVFIKMFLK